MGDVIDIRSILNHRRAARNIRPIEPLNLDADYARIDLMLSSIERKFRGLLWPDKK